jgi:hypothetical protein
MPGPAGLTGLREPAYRLPVVRSYLQSKGFLSCPSRIRLSNVWNHCSSAGS